MSSPIQANPNAIGDLPSKIVAPTGTPDYDAARARREQWYVKLFAEGELRSEEEKAQLEQILAEWEAEPVLTWEEISAQIDRSTTLDQILADLKAKAEIEK